MQIQTSYIKVRTFVTLDPTNDIVFTEKKRLFSDRVNDKIIDTEEFFRNRLMPEINDLIGLHNWALSISETPTEPVIYDFDVFAPNIDDFERINEIIRNKIDTANFINYKGTVSDYLDSYK